jgi:hypothetical protein
MTSLPAYNSATTATYFQWTTTSTTATMAGIPVGCANFDGVNNLFFPCPMAVPEPMTVGSFTITVEDSTLVPYTYSYALTMNWNPTQAAFQAGQAANFAAMIGQAGANLPPPIKIGAHLTPANPKFRNANYDTQAAWNKWIDTMNAAGVSILWIYPDADCFLGLRNSNSFPANNCVGLYAGAIAHAHGYGMSVRLSPGFYATQSCGDPPCLGTGSTPAAPTTGLSASCVIQSKGGAYTWGPLTHAINSVVLTTGNINYPHGLTSGVQDWYNCLTTPITGLNYGTPPTPPYCTSCSVYQYLAIGLGLQSGAMIVGPHEPTSQANGWAEGVNAMGCSSGTATPPAAQCNGTSTSGTVMTTGNTCPRDWMEQFATPWYSYMKGLSYLPAGLLLGASVDYHTEMAIAQVDTLCSGMTYAQCFASNLDSSVYIGSDLYVWTDGSYYSDTAAIPHYTTCPNTSWSKSIHSIKKRLQYLALTKRMLEVCIPYPARACAPRAHYKSFYALHF